MMDKCKIENGTGEKKAIEKLFFFFVSERSGRQKLPDVYWN